MRTTLFLFLTFAAPGLFADQPPNMKRLDASFLRAFSETRGFMLGRPANPKPTPDGNAVLFLRSGSRNPNRTLMEFDVSTGKTRELLTAATLLKGVEEQLTPEEKARRERMRVSAGGFADFYMNEKGTQVLLPLSGKLFVFDRSTEKARELTIPAGTILDPKWSPNGSKVSYVRDNDVRVFDLAANRETTVTTGGTDVKTNGLAEFVAQEEMGRFSGYWWSPDSKFIAFEEADHAGVETWYVADPSKPDQAPLKQYYPRPGKKNVAVRLGITSIAGGAVTWVEWDHTRFEYLASVRWDKEGPLTIQVQDRKQQHIDLLMVDPKTGKATKLLEEKDPAFTNLRQDMPRWLAGANDFLWISESPIGLGLEIRRADGSLKDLAVPFDASMSAFVYADQSRREVVFIGSSQTPEALAYRRQLPSEPAVRRPDSDKSTRLGKGQGNESVAFSDNKRSIVLTRTATTDLPRAQVLHDGVLVGELPSVAEEPGFNPSVTFEKPDGELGHYTATILPHDFDPKKKYPVLVDVYGGPHHLHVLDAKRNWLVPQWLADQGFIVVAIDNRGTPGRGRDWERSIYQKFGSVPIEDQVRVLKELGQKRPYMDLERIGIIGWSFGGYMSALAVLKRPDVFKAAVAGAPVTDWEDYDSHYTERYMGVLPESRKAYDESSLLPLAAKLERPLLLVHGTADDNVYYRHTLRLANALLRADRTFDVMPLPGITHMVTSDPVVFERYMTRAVQFFGKHLGAAK